jgi:hypothetical protein
LLLLGEAHKLATASSYCGWGIPPSFGKWSSRCFCKHCCLSTIWT